ncbi:hypothetical protein [Mesorhizobium sp. INR15]|uniref:hypothetical protein n=1 Tax=Mesorhizobium sp. INR15 TaxID=2654248 RepID=UPI0021560B68|nr:hypothetical protein [Mesorhizobium sp. INR15]
MGKALKQSIIATVLSGAIMGLTGCMSMAPRIEATEPPVKHRKIVHTTPPAKVVKYKKVAAKKVIKPAGEISEKPPVIPVLGGGNGGSGGSGGSSGGGGWGG